MINRAGSLGISIKFDANTASVISINARNVLLRITGARRCYDVILSALPVRDNISIYAK